jgi:hypothetical protein
MSIILEDALFVTTSVMSVVGIGGLLGMFRAIKASGSTETNRLRDMKEVRDAIGRIDHTLNNGGLVREIKQLQRDCGTQMMSVVRDLNAHEKLPGHADLPQQVAAITGRLESLEEQVRIHHGKTGS